MSGFGPATAIVLLGIGVLLVLGALIVLGLRDGGGGSRSCNQCGEVNAPGAHYCRRCGRGLHRG